MGIIIAFWLNNWGVTPLGPAESFAPFDAATTREAAGGSSSLAGFDQAAAAAAGGSSSLAGFDSSGRL